MARKRAKEIKSKKELFSKSTFKYGIIGLIIIIVVLLGSIFAFTLQDSSSVESDQSDKWLFAMDTSQAGVGSKTAYSTGYIPTLIIIDPDGNIIYRNYGVHTKAQLLQYIETISDGTASNLGAAPDFTLKTINNITFKLSDYKGKTVILDMMAVRCPPCHTQMPELQALKKEKGNDIVILSIDVDGAYGNEKKQDVINAFGEYIIR